MKETHPKKAISSKNGFRIGILFVLFFLFLSILLWGDRSFLFLGLAIVLIGIMIIIYYNIFRSK